MIAQVTIHDDGAVTVSVDTDDAGADDDTQKIAGLILDDMLGHATKTAVETWLAIRTEDA